MRREDTLLDLHDHLYDGRSSRPLEQVQAALVSLLSAEPLSLHAAAGSDMPATSLDREPSSRRAQPQRALRRHTSVAESSASTSFRGGEAPPDSRPGLTKVRRV